MWQNVWQDISAFQCSAVNLVGPQWLLATSSFSVGRKLKQQNAAEKRGVLQQQPISRTGQAAAAGSSSKLAASLWFLIHCSTSLLFWVLIQSWRVEYWRWEAGEQVTIARRRYLYRNVTPPARIGLHQTNPPPYLMWKVRMKTSIHSLRDYQNFICTWTWLKGLHTLFPYTQELHICPERIKWKAMCLML